jgi:amino acid transporter
LLNDFSVTIHIIGVIAIVAALFVFAPRQPASFFFSAVTHNQQGYPYWWAFIIGLLQAQWTFTGYDASASVSEETVDPRRRVPWGMVMAVVVSSIAGYLLLIALTLSIKDIPEVLNAKDPGGNDIPAVITILQNGLGSRAGALFSALVVMAMWFCGLSAVTWCSRVVYAFSRDNGLPVSHLWKQVSKKHLTPAHAIWLCVLVSFLAAVYSGAYSVVTSISVIGLYFSYTIPIYLRLRKRIATGISPQGPWHLGRSSTVINFIAIIWVAFISVILSLPDHGRAGKTIVAVTILLAVWYVLRERHRFKGPTFSAIPIAEVTPNN